jgi:hypothetical protein
MDTLHTVLRSIRRETKSSPDHLTVFREFLAHLDKIQYKLPAKDTAVRPMRAKPARRKSRKSAKAV